MKFVVIFSCVAVVLAYAAPQIQSTDQTTEEQFVLDQEPEIQINDDGSYILRIIGKDGIKYEEEGVVLTDEKTGEEIVITKKSTYSYLGKDGKVGQLVYDADKPIEADN